MVGVLWLVDNSVGFDPSPDSEGWPEAARWYSNLRSCWERDVPPKGYWQTWVGRRNGITFCICGPVEQVANLAELRCELG